MFLGNICSNGKAVHLTCIEKKPQKHYLITSFYYTSQVITPQAYRTSYLKCYKYTYFLLIMLICGFSFMWIHINMWFQMWFHMEIKTIFKNATTTFDYTLNPLYFP